MHMGRRSYSQRPTSPSASLRFCLSRSAILATWPVEDHLDLLGTCRPFRLCRLEPAEGLQVVSLTPHSPRQKR
ncbi:hypothetical protein GCM10010207_64500 [Streptomyces atratus]|nr:hypothetical protein GCM10010207_64500 [Streptomyces atratus]